MALQVDTMKARDIMSRNVITIHIDTNIKDMVEILKKNSITGVPVVDDSGTVLGVVSSSDVVQYACSSSPQSIVLQKTGRESSNFYTLGEALQFDYLSGDITAPVKDATVREIMTQSVHSVAEETPISEVATLMIERDIHRVIVMNGSEAKGVITTMDLIRLFQK